MVSSSIIDDCFYLYISNMGVRLYSVVWFVVDIELNVEELLG